MKGIAIISMSAMSIVGILLLLVGILDSGHQIMAVAGSILIGSAANANLK